MKKLLLLCALLGYSVLSMAQSYREVVYLKNGSVIKGIIIEQVPRESLKIKTADGSLFVYQMDEVAKITKEEVVSSENEKAKPIRSINRGYKGFVDIGSGFSVNDGQNSVFSFHTSHGYQFNPYFYLGGGLGLDFYAYPDIIELWLPIFLDFRVDFLDKRFTPYFDLKLGSYLNPSFGVSYMVGKKVALNFGVGYTMSVLYNAPRHSLLFRAGISF